MAETGQTTRAWKPLDPRRSRDLADARLQLHHAAQLVAAFGISYLPAQPDDSHTNMEWLESLGALASKPVGDPGIRLAVAPDPFALLVLGDGGTVVGVLSLDGVTIEAAARWVRARLAERGFDDARYTLKRHYQIPTHRVARGSAFGGAAEGSLEELGRWYSNAATVLESVTAAKPNASPVRCWPHHFDIATLLDLGAGKSISVGMEPGDDYWPEPYLYASMSPKPSADAQRPALAGGGVWNTRDWIGAALPGSPLGAAAQQEQVEAFIDSAIRACTALLR